MLGLFAEEAQLRPVPGGLIRSDLKFSRPEALEPEWNVSELFDLRRVALGETEFGFIAYAFRPTCSRLGNWMCKPSGFLSRELLLIDGAFPILPRRSSGGAVLTAVLGMGV
jgi:hypothetical protein